MLKNHSQFILATVLADGTKLPVDASGRPINAHSPENHMSYDSCMAAAKLTGYLPSFVLTDRDPYFCLDIDHCLLSDGETWSPLAVEMATETFAGARVEVSYRGQGLHIWARCENPPPHKTKNIKAGLELYHNNRFIILGQHPSGNEDLEASAAFRDIVGTYFMANEKAHGEDDQIEWTNEPVPEWNGPVDDDSLIETALARRGLGSVFSDDKVSFIDLWEHNEDRLSAAFPDHSGERSYDASSADMSLAQRLAYYTGKNCERIRRIMERSPLVREKWERRPDYLTRTILNACRMQTGVYNDARINTGADGRDHRLMRGWVDAADIPKVLSGCVYIVDQHAVLAPGQHTLMSPQVFNAYMGGYTFALDDNKTTRHAFEALTQCPTWQAPKAETICFRPELPFGELVYEDGRTLVNTYRPIETPAVPGDISRWDKLMNANFNPEDRRILENWIATLVQNPGEKIQWAPIIQGPEGNGKTFILDAIRTAVGELYCHSLNAHDIEGNGSKFTGWMERKLLVTVEEIRAGSKYEVVQRMLAWITNKKVEIQSKGQNQKSGDNRANFIFTSNHFDALNLRNDQRRFCPIATEPQTLEEVKKAGLTKPFFRDLWHWAEAKGQYAGRTPGFYHIANHFLNYDVQEPVIGEHAPRSKYYTAFFAAGTGRAEQEILEAIEQDLPGFRGDWVSTSALDGFLSQKRLSHKISHSKRHEILTQLNYTPHPSLKNGRATRTVLPDGCRPRLYVRRGVAASFITEPKEVCEAYTRAQTFDGERTVPTGHLKSVK